LTLSSSPIVMASSIINNPASVDLHGPRLSVVNYNYYASIDPAISGHMILGNELSLSTSEINTFKTDPSLTTGETPGFSNIGIIFNTVAPIVSNVNFRRAMLELQDFSASGYYENTMLSGVEGTASPANFPCFLFTAACTNFHGGRAENMYGAQSYTKAIADLKLAGLFEGNTTDITCSGGPAGSCPQLTWHTGSASGPVWGPNWVGRISLDRHDIAVYVIGQAANIGLVINYQEYAGYGAAAPYWVDPSSAIVEKDGVYNPSTGYNSPPVLNTSDAAVSCAFPCSTHDVWDMYSYGFLFTANPVPGVVEEFNSAYMSSQVNPADYYNASMDYATNKVLYATTVAGAVAGMGAAGLIQMQELPWINVYFENTLWVVLSAGWTGYTNIPTLGPNSGPGLFYTLLNLQQACFPLTCKTGGTANYGLESNVDYPGGLAIFTHFNTVYDADVLNQIYETPLTTGPNQFTVPGGLTNWMVSSATVKSFSGTVGPGNSGGWFMLQNFSDAQSTWQNSAKIVGGQVITLTFMKNIYWSDHVPITAYDYNFSLWASDLTNPPSLIGETTVDSGGFTGPSALIADKVVNAQTIQMYVNSSAVWNLAFTQVPIIPQHIFQYFNPQNSWTLSNTFETSSTWSGMGAAQGCVGTPGTPGACKKTATVPAWMLGLPNLEVASGPFMLRSWSGTPLASQHGQLIANPTYYRAAWYDNVTNNKVKVGATYNFKAAVYEWTYSTSKCASSPDKICKVPIASGVSAHLYYLNAAGAVLKTFTLTCNSKGICSGKIPTKGFAASTAGTSDELAFKATYTYLGLARTWYQLTGIDVHK